MELHTVLLLYYFACACKYFFYFIKLQQGSLIANMMLAAVLSTHCAQEYKHLFNFRKKRILWMCQLKSAVNNKRLGFKCLQSVQSSATSSEGGDNNVCSLHRNECNQVCNTQHGGPRLMLLTREI